MEYIRNTTKDKWTIMMYIKAREIRTSSAKEGANACNITFHGRHTKKEGRRILRRPSCYTIIY